MPEIFNLKITVADPVGSDYELKKVLPSKAQLAKCVADAERQIAVASKE